jgi:ABC-type sugar transport system substrate-binding protein
VPVIATANGTPAGFPANADLTTIDLGETLESQVIADWFAADSNGDANIVYLANNSPSVVKYDDAAKTELTRVCTTCSVTSVEYSTLGLDKVATAISAAVIAHPNANYIFASFDTVSGPFALQGAHEAQGRSLKVAASGAQPGGIQDIASGQMSADIGVDPIATMWNIADAAFRLLTGSAAVQYPPVVRLFTKDNLPTDTSASSWETGSWFTNGSFKSMYQQLWGL